MVERHWELDENGQFVSTLGQVYDVPSDAETADLENGNLNLVSSPLPPNSTPPPPPIGRTARLLPVTPSIAPSGPSRRGSRSPDSESFKNPLPQGAPGGTAGNQRLRPDRLVSRLREILDIEPNTPSPPQLPRVFSDHTLYSSPLSMFTEEELAPPSPVTFSPFRTGNLTPIGRVSSPPRHGIPFEPQSTSSPRPSQAGNQSHSTPSSSPPQSQRSKRGPGIWIPPIPPYPDSPSSSHFQETTKGFKLFEEKSHSYSTPPPQHHRQPEPSSQVPVNLPSLHEDEPGYGYDYYHWQSRQPPRGWAPASNGNGNTNGHRAPTSNANGNVNGHRWHPPPSRSSANPNKTQEPRTHPAPPPPDPAPYWPDGHIATSATPKYPHGYAPYVPSTPSSASPSPSPSPSAIQGWIPANQPGGQNRPPLRRMSNTVPMGDNRNQNRHDVGPRDQTKAQGKQRAVDPRSPSPATKAPQAPMRPPRVTPPPSPSDFTPEASQRRLDVLQGSVIRRWENLDSYLKRQTDPNFTTFIYNHLEVTTHIRKLFDKISEFLQRAIDEHRDFEHLWTNRWFKRWKKQLCSLDRTMEAFGRLSNLVCGRECSMKVLDKLLPKLRQYESKFLDLARKLDTAIKRLSIRRLHAALTEAHDNAREQLRLARSRRDLSGWDRDKALRGEWRKKYVMLRNIVAASRRNSWANTPPAPWSRI
ncbi:hypothetical protein C0991_002292 [Blastosporella zonata]|nr:hypothetical protein C0991_002292 [Blastosporella zonata]